MSDSTQIAIRPKASQQLATLIGMEPNAMLDVIKAQCFKGNPQNISDAQLAAFVSIAAEMGVNPLLPGMLYAFPIQGGGIVPMMGPDGVYKKLSEHPEVESWETTVYPEDVALPPTHAVTKIYRKGRERPLSYTALISEWKISTNGNWASRPRHMLSIRSLKQCARQIIHGVPYDEDERAIMGEVNVTGTGEDNSASTIVKRPPPPEKAKKGVNAITEPPKPDTKNEAIEAEIVKPEKQTSADISSIEKALAEEKVRKERMAAQLASSEVPANQANGSPAPVARAFLKDKEEFTGVCKIEKVSAFSMLVAGVPTPTVSAVVSGDFTGTVMHIGGGVALPEPGKFAPSPEWEVGSMVTLHLLGKGALTTKKNDKGEIAKDDKGVAIKVPTTLHTVIKIVPQEAASESPAVEMA